ncbi:MAG TPA: trypsin-like peptidase domain-containing protein [Polyangiaceae bacterium]|nr:trypsin-like peptidase domain-containing protein [Polyangiaceae bacterium]
MRECHRCLFLLFSVVVACAARAPVANTQPVRALPPASVAPPALSPAEIAARGLPSVVTIRTPRGLGTGFVVRSDGWIATNLHVLLGAAQVKVTLRDARELDVVELLAVSVDHDLALVRIEARGLAPLRLGDSDAMRPGDPIVAIGNPLGLEDTVSNGLVSARRKADDGSEMLQISAPIAPGSSGGPIFNDRGEVVGVATAVLQAGQNLNFGVPTHYLASMIARPVPMRFSDFAKRVARIHAAGSPDTERNVPRHPLSILDGCTLDAQKLIFNMIDDAISVGAPLYNEGKPEACYHVYDGAAADLVRRLPRACRGPARALGDAQKRAATLGGAIAQAWAIRDAFDALVEVVLRKQHGEP